MTTKWDKASNWCAIHWGEAVVFIEVLQIWTYWWAGPQLWEWLPSHGRCLLWRSIEGGICHYSRAWRSWTHDNRHASLKYSGFCQAGLWLHLTTLFIFAVPFYHHICFNHYEWYFEERLIKTLILAGCIISSLTTCHSNVISFFQLKRKQRLSPVF